MLHPTPELPLDVNVFITVTRRRARHEQCQLQGIQLARLESPSSNCLVAEFCSTSADIELQPSQLIANRPVPQSTDMRASVILRMYSSRLTLFTKAECGLCDTAKARLAQVQKRRTVEYKEVDIMNKDNHKWFNMYAFDVPVLHVSRVMHTYSKPDIVCEEKKLMHRFTEEDVEALIDEAEQQVQAG